VPDGDRGLRRDTVEQIGVVLSELSPRVQVKLHRAHQLARALHRDDKHVKRVAASLDAGGRTLVKLHHERTHGADGGADRLLVELADRAAGAVREVVLGFPVELRLGRLD